MGTLSEEVTQVGESVAKLLNTVIPTMNYYYVTPEYHELALILLISVSSLFIILIFIFHF
jgi:energy-converting hydrogenase Eha subunit E